jgi:hypothetical protein
MRLGLFDLDKEIYQHAYADSLEHIEEIFNRLCLKHRLEEKCKECPFLDEVEKLRLLIKNQQFAQVERELGYNLY